MFSSILGEREAVGKPFRDILGHVAGIVQVSADEGVDVIREVIFLQLREFRGIVVLRLLTASPDIHADAEFIPVRRGRLARGHPLVGRTVRLVAIRFRQDENLVGSRVITGTRERKDVVDLDITLFSQHATEINALTRVGILAALLVVQSDLIDVTAPHLIGIGKTEIFNDIVLGLLVCPAVVDVPAGNELLLVFSALKVICHLHAYLVG